MDREALEHVEDELPQGWGIVDVVQGVPVVGLTEALPTGPGTPGHDPGLEPSYYDEDYVDW